MNKWSYVVLPHSQQSIRLAVKNTVWQEYRKSLKGLPTHSKLDKLEVWLVAPPYGIASPSYEDRHTQVDNYLNALKRGGQLNHNLEVIK